MLRNIVFGMGVVGCILANPAPALAHDDDSHAADNDLQDYRFTLGLGGGGVRFDTNFNFTEKSTGRSVFVDAEGTLGLPETDGVEELRTEVSYGFDGIAIGLALGF